MLFSRWDSRGVFEVLADAFVKDLHVMNLKEMIDDCRLV